MRPTGKDVREYVLITIDVFNYVTESRQEDRSTLHLASHVSFSGWLESDRDEYVQQVLMIGEYVDGLLVLEKIIELIERLVDGKAFFFINASVKLRYFKRAP